MDQLLLQAPRFEYLEERQGTLYNCSQLPHDIEARTTKSY